MSKPNIKIPQRPEKPQIDIDPIHKLSDREFEVLCLISMGLSTKGIAEELDLAEPTVHTYRTRIKNKLGLDKPINTNILIYAAERDIITY